VGKYSDLIESKANAAEKPFLQYQTLPVDNAVEMHAAYSANLKFQGADAELYENPNLCLTQKCFAYDDAAV
jgi:hypothetical protein